MTKQELRDMLKVATQEYLQTNTITKCKTQKYKNITWPLERHPWGLYNRGRQTAQFKSATAPSVEYA